MFSIDNLLTRQTLRIQLQSALIVILSGACGLLWWGWLQAPRHLTVYLPPDISNGSVQKAGTIPKPFLYSFAFHILQALYYWPTTIPDKHGNYPYKQAILQYHAYLTPSFRGQLLKEYEQLKAANRLDRTREIQSSLGAAYRVGAVKQLTAHSWEVDIDVDLIERAHHMVVKHINLRYPLKIVRYDVSRDTNPYGLALAGFVGKPKRLLPSLLTQPKETSP